VLPRCGLGGHFHDAYFVVVTIVIVNRFDAWSALSHHHRGLCLREPTWCMNVFSVDVVVVVVVNRLAVGWPLIVHNYANTTATRSGNAGGGTRGSRDRSVVVASVLESRGRAASLVVATSSASVILEEARDRAHSWWRS